MGVRRALRRTLAGLAGLTLAAMVAAGLGVAGFALSHRDAPVPADVIVVLGGGPEDSYIRVDRGVALWRAGLAPEMVMTGRGEAGAWAMAGYAGRAGVPDDAIGVEPASASTLQNALFTRHILGDRATTAAILLVTHRTHLPRAWASFRWAGYAGPLTLIAADPPPSPGKLISDKNFWAETIKWPVNVVRAGLARAAEAVGIDLPQRLLR